MIVIVYGYDGSGPGHWQRWLHEELLGAGAVVRFPELPQPLAPQGDVWVGELREIVVSAPSPVTFVCHSLGCWALDHLIAEDGSAGIEAVLMVAPPSPHLLFEPVESFFPPPMRAEAWAPIAPRSLLVGSDNDEYASLEELSQIAARLGMQFHPLLGAGHINTSSGFGPWPFALEWLRRSRLLGC